MTGYHGFLLLAETNKVKKQTKAVNLNNTVLKCLLVFHEPHRLAKIKTT